MTQNNKILAILGMHRSGTSVTAQWLQKCGLNIGDQLYGADVGNPEGHFEDTEFLQVHEKILVHYDINIVGLTDHPLNNIDESCFAELKELVVSKNKLHEQWGWKEPRTCLFLKQYRSLPFNFKYFIIVRDYKDVVSSLVIRNVKGWSKGLFSAPSLNSPVKNFLYRKAWNFTKYKKNLSFFLSKYGDQYLKVWICYNEELLKHIEKTGVENIIVCDLPLLRKNSKSVFSFLRNDWNFDLNYSDFATIYKKDLISDHVNIRPFIKEKVLIEKADRLHLQLRKHLFSRVGNRQLI